MVGFNESDPTDTMSNCMAMSGSSYLRQSTSPTMSINGSIVRFVPRYGMPSMSRSSTHGSGCACCQRSIACSQGMPTRQLGVRERAKPKAIPTSHDAT